MTEQNQANGQVKEEKDFTTELTESIQKAEAVAQKFKQATIGIPFTIMKLSQLTRIPYDECRHKINSIARYALVTKQVKGGVELFSINLDPESRLNELQRQKERSIAETSYLNAIQQVIQQSIEDAANAPEPELKVVKEEEPA